MFSHVPEIAYKIHHEFFWPVMGAAAITLTIYSFINFKTELKELFKFKWSYVLFGIAHAIALYGLSRLGIWIFTEIIPQTKDQIIAIYQTRNQLDPIIIGLLLVFLIGPAEEIFWRGFIQKRLMGKFGKWTGTIVGIALYVGVHLPSLNPMLLLAATVLGLHWGLIYKKFKSLVPGIVSHAIWDAMIFVIFPVNFI